LSACEMPTTAGVLGATQGPQKLWDKWLKILHSRLFPQALVSGKKNIPRYYILLYTTRYVLPPL
jgi:hypothetical protein